MKIGLQVMDFNWQGTPMNIPTKLREIAQTADAGGFYSLWVMDHFFQMEFFSDPHDPMLEGYTTAAYLAALTERIKLGLLVTGVIYRFPGILVKTVTTLDVLSGGRAYLGIGAAWYEREALGLGVPYPSMAERFERLEETLQIAHHMWRGDETSFHGKHFTLQETITRPMPFSHPHPPIMIGGEGEKKTLRFVAQYGDACNLFYGGYEGYIDKLGMLRHKLDVLKQHCEDVGRDYATIEKTALGTIHLAADGQSSDQIIAMCRDLADAGIDHVIFNMPNTADIDPIAQLSQDVIPAVVDF